jgi:TRAP-type C4-dicarboxylate transport system substrate-binding protein
MKKCISIFSTILIALIFSCNVQAAGEAPKVLIKMASIAPKGSNIANSFEEMAREIKEKTNNEVAFKIYWGGVQGDEKDVIRKIRLGQLHGGGFMGPGLGLIVPEVRVTEVPYMFRNYEEVTYVRTKLQPAMEKLFEEKGFKVLGWMNLGFLYTFSREPLLSLDIARKQKWWTMEGEPIGKAMFQALDISPISLSISDVATALATNMINCASSTPFGAVAFQWYTTFKYMSSLPVSNINGATIVSKGVWDKITPASQKIMLDVANKRHDTIMKVTRQEDEKSIELLKKEGITIVPTDIKNKDQQYVFDASKKVREDLVGTLYSKELLDRTLMLIDEYRRTHPNDTTVIRLD